MDVPEAIPLPVSSRVRFIASSGHCALNTWYVGERRSAASASRHPGHVTTLAKEKIAPPYHTNPPGNPQELISTNFDGI